MVAYGTADMSVTVDGVAPDPSATAIEGPDAVYVLRGGRQTIVRLKNFEGIDVGQIEGDGVIKAPMHGKVLAVLVEVGENVAKGHRLAIIEAMKMEHALSAPLDGVVSEIAVKTGAQVAEGAKVMVIAARDAKIE